MAGMALLDRLVTEWFAEHRRDLPWRSSTPWGVYVSEIMLQQTPVNRVLPAWHEWLRRWPSPTTLADDSPGEAIRAWGRLGYPRRAKRMHEAAVIMRDRFNGEVPAGEQDLLTLPGWAHTPPRPWPPSPTAGTASWWTSTSVASWSGS